MGRGHAGTVARLTHTSQDVLHRLLLDRDAPEQRAGSRTQSRAEVSLLLKQLPTQTQLLPEPQVLLWKRVQTECRDTPALSLTYMQKNTHIDSTTSLPLRRTQQLSQNAQDPALLPVNRWPSPQVCLCSAPYFVIYPPPPPCRQKPGHIRKQEPVLLFLGYFPSVVRREGCFLNMQPDIKQKLYYL